MNEFLLGQEVTFPLYGPKPPYDLVGVVVAVGYDPGTIRFTLLIRSGKALYTRGTNEITINAS